MLSETKYNWWQDTIFYEIYIASFQDGNGDGIGDFNGLTSRLDYLQELGVNGLWITPFYPSPKVDNGYDIADHCDVDPSFGDLADFDHFIDQAHQRNIRVIIDVVLNHVSTEHFWFRAALSDPKGKYRDYFFFRDRPNGWESFFGGSAWHKEPGGDQVYYHKFAPEQADLNWQNPAVKDDMLAMLKFWLDRGVDGFRFDVINFLSCDGIGAENPRDDDGQQIHLNDIDQPGIYDCLAEICGYVRDYGHRAGKAYFLVGEVGHEDLTGLAPYQRDDLLDVVFNFNLGSMAEFDIGKVYQQLVAMEERLDGLPTIFFNSHDMARSMSRLCHDDESQAAALAALTLTAKGISFLYFGEEIGLPSFIPGSIDDIRDIQAINHYHLARAEGKTDRQAYGMALENCRDKSRLYMQWNSDKFSGFSSSTPWIGGKAPENLPNVKNLPNVACQINDDDSLWHWYRKLIKLRRDNPALMAGDYDDLSLRGNILSISRRWQDQVIHILINFGGEEQPVIHNDSRDILAGRGVDINAPHKLSPYGILITREQINAC